MRDPCFDLQGNFTCRAEQKMSGIDVFVTCIGAILFVIYTIAIFGMVKMRLTGNFDEK